MPTANLDSQGQPLFVAGTGPWLLVNASTTAVAYIDTTPNVNAGSSIPVPPQASISVDGSQQWWGASLSDSIIEMLILPGGTEWQNPVGVQVALADLGLATEAEQVTQTGAINGVNTTLGTPAQHADVTTTLPSALQAAGVPPYIPGLRSAALSQMSAAGSPYSLVTFSGNSRIWYASLSFAVSTDASYSAGADGPFAELYIQSIGQIILICQVAINAPDQAVNSDQSLSFGGIEVASGDSVFANINNGNAITDALIRAGAVLLYTTP